MMARTIKSSQNILVIKLGALGDFIQALGAMAAIRQHHMDSKITLLTTPAYESFAKECPYFDDVALDVRPKFMDFSGWASLIKIFKQGQYSRVYDLQNNDRTSLYFKLFSLFQKNLEWVGAAKGASHCNISPERIAGHALDGHKQTLKLAGIKDVSLDELQWMQADISKFSLKTPYILMVPGSSPSRLEKRWPASSYACLAQMLSEWGYQIVLLGTEAEKEITQNIQNQCENCIDLAGKTNLFEIVSMARQAQGAFGNDTGPMHAIAATRCPSIVLFSQASNPIRHAPKGKMVQVLQEDSLEDLLPEKVLQSFKVLEKTSDFSKVMH